MKSFITKILSILLAVTVLYSTSTFVVDMHFCCNQLVDMAILGKAKPCDKKIKDNTDQSSKRCLVIDQNCCSDKTFIKEGDDSIKTASFKLDAKTIVFINAFHYSYKNLFEGLEENVTPFREYAPPLIWKNILVLHETFLI